MAHLMVFVFQEPETGNLFWQQPPDKLRLPHGLSATRSEASKVDSFVRNFLPTPFPFVEEFGDGAGLAVEAEELERGMAAQFLHAGG